MNDVMLDFFFFDKMSYLSIKYYVSTLSNVNITELIFLRRFFNVLTMDTMLQFLNVKCTMFLKRFNHNKKSEKSFYRIDLS